MPCPRYILFDLDSTLYSKSYGLEQAVSRRVNEYIAAFFKTSLEEAWEKRRVGITSGGYGTTLEWLLAETDFPSSSVEDYFAFIHPENEADALPPDPGLSSLLDAIPLPKAILSNAPHEHAVRILKRLGVEGRFTSIFDIRFNGLKGKPRPGAFLRPLEALGVEITQCALVDDVPVNVESCRALGGTGILFDEYDKRRDFPGLRVTRLEELSTLPALWAERP
jgi:putative hydrolase of the HAD superfamily